MLSVTLGGLMWMTSPDSLMIVRRPSGAAFSLGTISALERSGPYPYGPFPPGGRCVDGAQRLGSW